MSKNLPEILFATSDKKAREELQKLKDQGLVRKIGPRLYTSVSTNIEEKAVYRNWSTIIDTLYPGSLISHRSALEFSPDQNKIVYLTANATKKISFPGLTIKFIKGPKPLKDDNPFLTNLKSSSISRALLENLQTTRDRKKSKVLETKELEKKIESILQNDGEQEINSIRDRAREISQEFGWNREFKELNRMIGAILGTRSVNNLKSAKAKARNLGRPYDGECFERLSILFSTLKSTTLRSNKETNQEYNHFKHKAFFESYFSNYIEGTTFEIDEAEEIIFDKKIPKERPKDAHDIVATYLIVSDKNEMKQTPTNYKELLELLQHRHAILMKERTDKLPGKFKERANRAGSTHFIQPDLVKGTLEKGITLYNSLDVGIPRALFIKLLISEIHPFEDGNGRIARIMMNAELVSQNISTIIIPTVYREDYLLSLRALSRRHRPDPYIKMLLKAHSFSANIDFSNYPKVLKELISKNWFIEPDDGKIIL